MAVFIKTQKEGQEERIVYTHYFPEELSDDFKMTGYLLNNIPEPEIIPNKYAVGYYNPTTKTVYYKYFDSIPTRDEEIERLKQQLTTAEQAITELSILVGELMNNVQSK